MWEKQTVGFPPRTQPETLSTVPLWNLISLIHSLLKEKKKINMERSLHQYIKELCYENPRRKHWEKWESFRSCERRTPPDTSTSPDEHAVPELLAPRLPYKVERSLQGEAGFSAATKGMRALPHSGRLLKRQWAFYHVSKVIWGKKRRSEERLQIEEALN